MELCRNSIKSLALVLILLSFLCGCTRGIPLLVLPSSDGTQEIEQILQSCGITVLVRYTLECVPALHALDEEPKIFKLFLMSFQSKVGGFKESVGEPLISVKAFVKASMMAL